MRRVGERDLARALAARHEFRRTKTALTITRIEGSNQNGQIKSRSDGSVGRHRLPGRAPAGNAPGSQAFRSDQIIPTGLFTASQDSRDPASPEAEGENEGSRAGSKSGRLATRMSMP